MNELADANICPGDLIWSQREGLCLLSPTLHIYENNTFSYDSYGIPNLELRTICFTVAVVEVLMRSGNPVNMAYFVTPRIVGWDYTDFYAHTR